MPTIKKSVRRPWQPEYKPQQGRIHSNTKFYQSSPWRRLRLMQLQRSPICEECARNGVTTLAKVADHIIPINQGGEPLDIENLQSLCHACHNRKSGRETHQRNKLN